MRILSALSLSLTLGCTGPQLRPLVEGENDTGSSGEDTAQVEDTSDTGAVDTGSPLDSGDTGTPPDTGDTDTGDTGDTDTGDTGGGTDTGDTGGADPLPQTVVIEEQGAGYCEADGDVETEHAGYSGPGYVNGDNSIGASMVWSVETTHAGPAELTWRFASGSQRAATLWVNDVPVTTPLGFIDTGAWDNWATLTTTVDFALGENRLTLRADGPDGLPNIDHLEVFGVGVIAGDCRSLPTGPGTCGCASPAGEWGIVNQTIVVGPGEVFDGGCQVYRANPDTLGDGSQSESQLPVFRLENGATMRNVILGGPAADGVHLYGDVTLENIRWLDVGEDAMTVKQEGTVSLDCGSANLAEDKIFQVNASSTIYISNFTATNAATFMRQNGGTTFEVNAFIDRSDISNAETVFWTDGPTSHVTMTNTRYRNITKRLFRYDDVEANGNSPFSTVINSEEY